MLVKLRIMGARLFTSIGVPGARHLAAVELAEPNHEHIGDGEHVVEIKDMHASWSVSSVDCHGISLFCCMMMSQFKYRLTALKCKMSVEI